MSQGYIGDQKGLTDIFTPDIISLINALTLIRAARKVQGGLPAPTLAAMLICKPYSCPFTYPRLSRFEMFQNLSLEDP